MVTALTLPLLARYGYARPHQREGRPPPAANVPTEGHDELAEAGAVQ
jgi:hypothetical protein